jgi:hypothetical protein
MIGTMVYSFARVGATVTMKVGDYFQHRQRRWIRLHEKGGKRHEVPCHPSLEELLNVWVAAAGIGRDKKGPLFRSMSKGDKLIDNPMTRFDVLHMIKRRAQAAGLPYSTCCHTSVRPASPHILKMGAHSSMPRPSPTTNLPERSSFTIAPERIFFRRSGKDQNLKLTSSGDTSFYGPARPAQSRQVCSVWFGT